jgi:NTP pyrophosphatase (non-canonical NTP hydrolase)
MEFGDYQRWAKLTDQTPGEGEFQTAIQVLALQSKVGDLAGVFKKFYRKQISARALENSIERSIGDILWYLVAVANSRNLSLDEIAAHNLVRVRRRYGETDPGLFDPSRTRINTLRESFPPELKFDFHCFEDLTGRKVMQVRVLGPDGSPVGDDIDDNEYKEDHYRYHDALHISFMTFIGWSPVMRKLLSVKRKSSEILDRIEDGAKARDIEEALSRKIFQYFLDNQFLDGVNEIDTDLLTSIPGFLGDRESVWIAEAQWETAILEAASVIRNLIKFGGGRVIADLPGRALRFEAFS